MSTSNFMVTLQRACWTIGRVGLVLPRQILKHVPDATKQQQELGRDPFYWRVSFVHKGERIELGCKPDRVFALHFFDTNLRVNYLLEIDRGTEDLLPTNRSNKALEKNQSIFRKVLTYHHSIKEGLHTKHLRFQNVRVLFVTTSTDRVENAITAANVVQDQLSYPYHKRDFLFTDQAAVVTENILTHGWRNHLDTKLITLIDD